MAFGITTGSDFTPCTPVERRAERSVEVEQFIIRRIGHLHHTKRWTVTTIAATIRVTEAFVLAALEVGKP